MLRQIDSYYEATKYVLPKHPYKIGDDVYLSKGTLLHGTYKNFDGLKIVVWYLVGLLMEEYLNILVLLGYGIYKMIVYWETI